MRIGDVGSQRQRGNRRRLSRLAVRRRRGILGWILALAFLAMIPPLFFHFGLRPFTKMPSRKCAWLDDPPLVCAHGGDATYAAPNSMKAYEDAINSHVDCMEIDVSRSSDGELFALHDRDLQRITGNGSTRVGHWKKDELRRLEEVVTVEDAVLLASNAVKRVVLDVKVGPPFYEKGLASDLISLAQKARCVNCVIWSKSDALVGDIIRESKDFLIGYIVMLDPSTGTTSKLLRIKRADVVGVYHPLIDQKMMKTLHEGGKKVYAWTVDDEPSMQRMLSVGVDAVITSRPMVLQEIMQNSRAQCRQNSLFW